MKKKYLKSVEDVLALKDTDTKIYRDGVEGYYQFFNGVICRFVDDYWLVGSCIDSDDKAYILEEEPMQEATEDDIGCLCWFSDTDGYGKYSILREVEENSESASGFCFSDDYGEGWYRCRRLSPSEVAEITGYKVSFVDQSATKVEEK